MLSALLRFSILYTESILSFSLCLSIGSKVEMTVPVSTSVEANGEYMVDADMCFFIPQVHQASPPQPTADNVQIQVRPEMTVYTRWNINKYSE